MTREIRRAQLISPYGVGAVFDICDEGFVLKDISSWTRPGTILKSPEIRRHLGGRDLRALTGDSNDETVPVERFPRWHYCSKCRNLGFWDRKNDWDAPDIVPSCCKGAPMVPMRFVAVCDNGHLTEIDWYKWAHRGQQVANTGQCDRGNINLKFFSSGKFGGDFDQMKVECKNCGAGETLIDIQNRSASPGVVSAKYPNNCCGKQPWQRLDNAVDCNKAMFIEPRGSSSIYRARGVSALDLADNETPGPGDKRKQVIISDPSFKDLVKNIIIQEGSQQVAAQKVIKGRFDAFIQTTAKTLNEDFNLVKELVVQNLEQVDENVEAVNNFDESSEEEESFANRLAAGQREIQVEEFRVFSKHKNIENENLDLSFLEFGSNNPVYNELFSTIGQVRRLREVRCFVGFSRGNGAKLVPADLGTNISWLPAIEAFGEGIYLELRDSAVKNWISANQGKTKKRLEGLNDRFETSFLKKFYKIDITAPFLLAHTLSHFLIRELTYQSGYPSSSLKERIYSGPEEQKAGLLIYTSDIDQAGTLGGLVEQGRPDRLAKVLEDIARKASWCSADPVCRELEHQGLAGLNNAACHCCSLISETSCTFSNVFLNRLLVTGNGNGDEPLGFLDKLVMGEE